MMQTTAQNDLLKQKGIILVPSDIISVGAEKWVSILKENKLNLLSLHTNKANLGTINDLEKLIKSDEGKKLLSLCSKNNIGVEYQLHLLEELMPRHHFNENPEYFPMDTSGVRQQKKNICFSSEGAYKEIEKSILKLTKWLKPTTHRYIFWTDDGYGSYCHCEKCDEFTPSEQALLYENKLLEMLRKVDPVATVAHLAYHNTLEVPRKVKPAKGVYLEYAPIKRDYSVPLPKEHKKNLKENLEVFPTETALVIEYWLDASFVSRWKRKNLTELSWSKENCQRDVNDYQSIGIQSITSFALWLDKDYYEKFGYGKAMQIFKEYGEVLNK